MVPSSKLRLLLSPSESERRGVEARNILFGKWLTEKMADECHRVIILLGYGCQVLL